jgi:uncharacterized protein YkwD
MTPLRAAFGLAMAAFALLCLNQVVPLLIPDEPAACPPPKKVVKKPPPIGNQCEMDVIRLTNIERNKHGLASLKPVPEIMRFARNWSAVMNAGRMHHSKGPYGENVAKGYQSPEATVRAWMHSPGHRRNILNSRYTTIGVGQVGASYTQVFR